MIKTRVFPEHNYKGIHINGKTIRIALDLSKPIGELIYPEFYDVKLTSYCKGNCPYCYQNSENTKIHDLDIVKKFSDFFGSMDENQKPFQIAFGGGEPTSHPQFTQIMKACFDMGISPNYTTNGMWSLSPNEANKILEVTKKYCGGVAVSTHSHLQQYWKAAVDLYLKNDIFTNLHVIIDGKKSIDEFVEIYNQYTGKIKYFVVLPLTAQGRAKKASIDWQYFSDSIKGSPGDIAFGANFYPYLTKDPNRFKVSLYEPEIFSKYLDLETMKIYHSSFSECPI